MRADSIQVRGLKALVLILLVLYEGHTKETCRTGVKTDKNLRGVNLDKTSGLPFYWFDLHRASDGYHSEYTYTFRLHSSSEASPFSDAVLQVETANNCGTGDLVVNTTFLYQPRNCPKMIMTEYKKPMTNVPFKWRAPKCGCIKFRATVIRNGVTYFYDDENISDGNLVKTVCPHGVRVAEQLVEVDEKTTDSTTKTLSTVTSKMDRAALLDLLCKITSTLNNLELLKRPEFIQRRKLQNSSLVKLLNIELALEQRKADISSCCHKKGEDKTICFDNVRRYRIDQLCGDGQPRIPFVEQKRNYMRKRESECCWRIGQPRYQCFSKSSEQLTEYSVDYSLDESDPANDIADYPKEVERYEMASNTKFFSPPPTLKPDNQNIETLTKLEETTTPTSVTKSVTLPPIRQPSARPHRQTTPTSVLTHHRQRPVPAVKTKLRQSRTVGQGDMGYNLRKQAKYTRKTTNLRHSASSVEITVNTLKQKLWKSSLKLECCQQGRIFAAKTGRTDVWDRCRSAAKDFRSSVVRGKKICSNTFQKCCVEQFITATAKASTIPKPNTPKGSPSTKQLVTTTSLRTNIKKENYRRAPLDVDSSREADEKYASMESKAEDDLMEQDDKASAEDAGEHVDDDGDDVSDDSDNDDQGEDGDQDEDDDQDDDDKDGDVDDDKVDEINNDEKNRKRKFIDYPREDPSADTFHNLQTKRKSTPNTDIAHRDSNHRNLKIESAKRKRNRRRHNRKLRRRKHKSD
ncbi:hypothetical protein LOTGIDRAFT_172798 [Lottia gigantea]|uniref:Reelin domain-containing protein n=1 Tax=Lottia gigantea TaxID=225164 RepID=V4CG75_LOTGI|nr:hypothetical protein LOTGIDRAFT_172798 [Lottia gigantea]ESP01065.1 hypothetical protein LOTGIDRAFT_172798 [Lottia gigantea]